MAEPQTPPSSTVPARIGRPVALGFLLAGVLLVVGINGVSRHHQLQKANNQDQRQWDEAVKAQQNNLAGSYLSALHANRSGQAKEAGEYIEKAMNFQKENSGLRQLRYEQAVLAGDYAAALKVAEKHINDGQSLLPPPLLEAAVAIKGNDFATAQKQLESLPPAGLNLVFGPVIKGWVVLQQGGKVDIAALDLLQSRSGEFAPLIYPALAFLYQGAGEKPRGDLLMGRLLQMPGLPLHTQQMMLGYFRKTGDQESLAKLMAMPHASAIAMNHKALMPDNPSRAFAEVMYSEARVIELLNAPLEATTPLRLALYMEPEFDSARFQLGAVEQKRERPAEALAAYQSVAQDSPLYLKAQVQVAYVLQDQKKLPEAMKVVDALISKFPKAVEPLVAKADILRGESKFKDAIALYDQALKLDSAAGQLWPLYYARGISFERDGQWNAAEQDLKKALALEPEQPDVLNYLGYTYLTHGEHVTEAKAMIERALAQRPDDAAIIDSMGWALYRQGEYEKALPLLEKAIDIEPRDVTLNEHLGDVYWRLGYQVQARYQWERALFFEPEEKGAAEKLKEKIDKGLPALGKEQAEAQPLSPPLASKAEALR